MLLVFVVAFFWRNDVVDRPGQGDVGGGESA
jgi:hypothetical protein